MDKEHLIAQLKQIEQSLRRFLIFTQQFQDWESDPTMAESLPDLRDRRRNALSDYLLVNDVEEPLIPHDQINPKKVEAIAFLIEIELAKNIEDALEMIGPGFDSRP